MPLSHSGSTLHFTGAKDNGDGGDKWKHKTCETPVKSSPSTNHHPAFYRLDALPVTEPRALKGKISLH